MKISVPSCFSLSIDDRRWFVLMIKGGMEDAVFAELSAKGYDVYLPRRRFDQHHRRNRVWVEKNAPALPGYAFIVHPRKTGVIDDWTEVSGVNGVRGPLAGHDGPLRIPGAVVETVLADEFNSVYDETAAGKRAKGESERANLERRFPLGSSMLVAEGPFAGFMAEVDELTHDDRIKALVDLFGRMTPIVFDPGHLGEPTKKRKKAA